MLSGDNGILQKATTAKDNTDSSQIQERINLAYHSALTSGLGKVEEDTLKDEIKKEFNKTDSELDEENWLDKTSVTGKWRITIDKVSLDIPAGIEDNSKVAIKIGTTNLKDVSDLTTLYGETTDFKSITNVQWQFFYDDDDWIYLVASDYVPVDTLPDELIKEEQAEGETKYCAGFSTTGAIMQNEPWSRGANSNTVTSNPQTSTYLKWVNADIVTIKDNANMKVIAFMMDTSKWSNFAGNVNGAYAIGGPTIEMFALSYNAKHDVKMGTYETLNSDNINSNGYAVKIGDSSWVNCGGNLDASSDNMWVGKSPAKAQNWLLCSPSNTAGELLCNVERSGFLNNTVPITTTQYTGFRPLVAIPKSSLK